MLSTQPLCVPNQARAAEEAGTLRAENDGLRMEIASIGRQVGELQESLAHAKVWPPHSAFAACA